MKDFHKLTMLGEFQRGCSAYVSRNVVQDCTAFINGLARSYEAQEALEVDEDQIFNVTRRPADVDDFKDQWQGEPDAIDSMIDEYPNEIEAWQALYDEAGQEYPEGCEALCFYIVTDYLAAYLETRGEAIEYDIAGFTVWGRCTYGQLIASDGVIERIYWDTLYTKEQEELIKKLEE